MTEYIDREALEVALNHRLNFLMAENGEYDNYTSGFDEAVTRVENFPAADVSPVQRGERTIRERFEAAFPRCRIDEYGEPAEICPASLAGKECPATDKPTCMNCPAWDWPAE